MKTKYYGDLHELFLLLTSRLPVAQEVSGTTPGRRVSCSSLDLFFSCFCAFFQSKQTKVTLLVEDAVGELTKVR